VARGRRQLLAGQPRAVARGQDPRRVDPGRDLDRALRCGRGAARGADLADLPRPVGLLAGARAGRRPVMAGALTRASPPEGEVSGRVTGNGGGDRATEGGPPCSAIRTSATTG